MRNIPVPPYLRERATEIYKDYGESINIPSCHFEPMKRIIILGTSHIAPESRERVEHTILTYKPDIIAIELDRARLEALLHPKQERVRLRDIRRIGLNGWIFAQLGAWAEHALGAKVGTKPGVEMLKAVELAQQTNTALALIDQDITITLKRLRAITWKEKFRFVIDIFKNIFFKKGIEFDLATVPEQELIEKLISDVKQRYPTLYRVLVLERNEYMARKLSRLYFAHPDKLILAIVGAGHQQEIATLLQKYIKEHNQQTPT